MDRLVGLDGDLSQEHQIELYAAAVEFPNKRCAFTRPNRREWANAFRLQKSSTRPRPSITSILTRNRSNNGKNYTRIHYEGCIVFTAFVPTKSSFTDDENLERLQIYGQMVVVNPIILWINGSGQHQILSLGYATQASFEGYLERSFRAHLAHTVR